MRIALISDIHANLPALESVLVDAKTRAVDKIVCLGDIVDLGPRPAEVIDLIRSTGIECIQGNHDPLDEHPSLDVLKEVEAWTLDTLDNEQKQWLNNLPLQHVEPFDGFALLCVHGSPLSNQQGMEPDTPRAVLETWLENVEQDVIAAGHTHMQFSRRLDHRLVINTGSVGMPFMGPLVGPPDILKSIDYCILSDTYGTQNVELIRLPLDYDAFVKSFDGTSFPKPKSWLSRWQ